MPKIGMEQIRREEVISATKRCLAKNGFSKLSVKAIAEEAGVSTGIIYHYFKNKEDLLLNVIKEAFSRSHENVMQVVEPLTSERDKLFKHLESIHAVVVDNPEFYTVLLNFLGQAPYNDEIKRIMTKFLSNLTSYAGRYLEDGVAHNQFSENKIKDLHTLLIALGMGLGIMCTLAPDTFNHEALGESYKEFVRRHVE
ncbi:TetR/AcrR family transcriptional regulator [Desulfomonile tiedjei]|uniref:Transcriptional regulator n=1 Tax=Desulfomonile tiedjei (strain ATCC 49306 / DSM 6799 / DCB-1) TaxID=706587 RepID=I4C7Y6_DESTA|nr:TetR family transcriptional regulator [Desulfomonile tiedjei]AFM25677.1 transcriptional regulator [Desulfomonile tiedjei DSM 6799]